jgi:Na+-translocating ferredoxin:NAD+ oxidoreductase RnfG subunit
MRVRWLGQVSVAVAAAACVQVGYATQYLTIEQAQRAAFPLAAEFRDSGAIDAATVASIGAPAGWSPRVFEARDAQRRLGWLIVDQAIGKSELITYALALDDQGKVLSLDVLDYREAHGGEIRLAPWRKQFVGKSAADSVELNRDIKNISGATLSCRHITEGVQRLLKLHAAALKARADVR